MKFQDAFFLSYDVILDRIEVFILKAYISFSHAAIRESIAFPNVSLLLILRNGNVERRERFSQTIFANYEYFFWGGGDELVRNENSGSFIICWDRPCKLPALWPKIQHKVHRPSAVGSDN